MKMWVVSGVITISIGSNTFMMRGMPGGRHIQEGSVPIPPDFWSATLSSKIFWYSGVSGALSPGCTQIGRKPSGRCHLPFQSGYFNSSKAKAGAASAHRPAAASMRATQDR